MHERRHRGLRPRKWRTTSRVVSLAPGEQVVDNTATPESAVRSYLQSAYHLDPLQGFGDWRGAGGLTSNAAVASHDRLTGNFKISVGYVNGAYESDPLIGGVIPGQEALSGGQIVVRAALYGDFNLNGRVDDTDLAIFSGLGMYNQPADRFGWLCGDLNYDGKVDDTDLQICSGAGNYNGPGFPAMVAEGAAVAAVPEPEQRLLSAIGAGAAGLVRRRRRRG